MRRLMILWAEDRDCRLLGARINRHVVIAQI
jgi:hypothetical protein